VRKHEFGGGCHDQLQLTIDDRKKHSRQQMTNWAEDVATMAMGEVYVALLK
jgi:hypothetical protein